MTPSGPLLPALVALACGVLPLSACAKDRIKPADESLAAAYRVAQTGDDASATVDDTSASRDAAISLDATVPDASTGPSDGSARPTDARIEDSSVPKGGSGGRGGNGTAGSGAAGSDAASKPAGNGCDLTGKWIATQRSLQDAVGGMVVQSGHSWSYWEFEQRNSQAVVKKVLQCGEEVKDHSVTGLGTQVTSTQALWDGMTLNNKVLDGKATYGPVPGSEQCQLQIDKCAVVRGATFSYFSAFGAGGFTHPFDETMQTAQGSTPGSEDWDNDGNPGVTYHVSGIANGDIYMAQRDLAEYKGTTDKRSDKFRLWVTRLHEQQVLGQNPATLPSADVTPSADPEEHFIWFARVDGLPRWDLAANADDLAICTKMRALKDQLIPEGNL
jgi:hypothetical protein